MALIAACALEPGDYFTIDIAQETPEEPAADRGVTDAAAADDWDIEN